MSAKNRGRYHIHFQDRFPHLLRYYIHTTLYLHDMKQDCFLTMKGSMHVTYCMAAIMVQSTPELISCAAEL